MERITEKQDFQQVETDERAEANGQLEYLKL